MSEVTVIFDQSPISCTMSISAIVCVVSGAQGPPASGFVAGLGTLTGPAANLTIDTAAGQPISAFAAASHASSHATGEADPISPSDIGAASAASFEAGAGKLTGPATALTIGTAAGRSANQDLRTTDSVAFSGMTVSAAINLTPDDIEVPSKNKYRPLLIHAGSVVARYQDYYWNGSAYVATYSYGFGLNALQNNTGSSSNGFGYYALQNNTGSSSNGFGYAVLYSNTGSSSNGFGCGALYSNTGTYSNGFGHYALYSNTGSSSNGFGYYALQNNTGSSSNGFGHSALQNNTGTYSNGFGYYALRNNNWPNAIGIGHQSAAGGYFLANASTAKTFTDAEITANTITITGHGFPGANGAKINLKFTTTAGTPPTGLVSGTVYQFTRADANKLTLAGIVANASVDFQGKLENSVDITNSIAIGTDANADKANQVVLGNSSITETVLRGTVICGNIAATGTIRPGSMTVATATASSSATAVAAGAGAITYITDETGGATPAFSDGTVWRRVSDLASIS